MNVRVPPKEQSSRELPGIRARMAPAAQSAGRHLCHTIPRGPPW
jgi:hypothetical protein